MHPLWPHNYILWKVVHRNTWYVCIILVGNINWCSGHTICSSLSLDFWGCPGVPVHGGIPIVFTSIHGVVTQFVNVSFLCVPVHEDTTGFLLSLPYLPMFLHSFLHHMQLCNMIVLAARWMGTLWPPNCAFKAPKNRQRSSNKRGSLETKFCLVGEIGGKVSLAQVPHAARAVQVSMG